MVTLLFNWGLGFLGGFALANIIRLQKVRAVLRDFKLNDAVTLEELERGRIRLDVLKNFSYFFI